MCYCQTGEETYELEIEYEEKECDKSSESTEEIKKCLHNGMVPDVYEEVIEKIEVVEAKKKVVDEPAEMAEPYTTEEEMKERAGEGFYVRDPERDKVHCPGGAVLRRKSIKKMEIRDMQIKQHAQNVHIGIDV